MINPQTRQQIWNEFFDIEGTCRYYEAVHSRNARCHFWVRLSTLLLVAGAITSILDAMPWFNNIFGILAIAVATGLTIWDAVSNYQKKAAIAHIIHFQCSILRIELRDLWLSVDDKSADETRMREELLRLSRLHKEVENWAGFSDIQVDSKLSKRTASDAKQVLTDRYLRSNNPTEGTTAG